MTRWTDGPASGALRLAQVNGAGQGLDDYQMQHIEDFDDAADLRGALQSLPKAALPAPQIAEVRRAAKQFKWHAGQGADKLAP
eukprot:4678691-Pyramimonas_sp.AAC.1